MDRDRLTRWIAGKWLPRASEAEARLVGRLRWANPAVRWYTQVCVATSHATFWLDCAGLVAPGRALAFECDGPYWHPDPTRDFVRDCLILATGRLAAVYRVRSWDVLTRPAAWLAAIARHEPDLVAADRRELLEQLARADLSRHGLCQPPTVIATRAGGKGVSDCQQFAQACVGLGFKALVEEYRKWRK